MGSPAGGEGMRGSGVTGTTIIRAKDYSPIWSPLALALWLGGIQFNALLIIAALLLLPLRFATAVFAMQLLAMLLPLSDTNKLGRKLSRFICKYAVGYFPVTLHVEDINAFDPAQSYIFGYEPHSVVAIGFCAFAQDTGMLPLPKIKILASTALLSIPFLRQIWSWMGFVLATRKSFYKYLEDGYSCLIVPGGVREILYMDDISEVAFLKARKGFIKIAMETGRPLVPVFCFGQCKVFKWRKLNSTIATKIARAIQFAPIIFWGRYGSSIPFRHPMHVVVGRPIEVKKNPNPSMDEVNEVQAQFISAMEELFERHKGEAGYPDLNLRVL
ncbi:hypothetical protein HPP92_015232 [Vanilla planifolia]|uniref:Acyltransferase n=1 Tax=Vanilla planifolia TaxID=51239 RepID=A0A835QR14_VANPL|nr:hypothetical protein HPP92_015750 [Vanilla planifolia]KAG0475546.1 hypothetical protein HPP92_015232 [Vanilla planifolia]